MYPARQILAYAVVTVFLVFVLSFGVTDSIFQQWKRKDRSEQAIPDFSRYESLHRVLEGGFPLDDPTKRVIIVGDIHGMIDPLHTLLSRLSYDSRSDVLVHTGDIVSRGPHKGSMAVLAFMVSNNVTGVRGNHDQKIVEWRGWIDWIQTMPQGRRWLERMERRWQESNENVTRAKFWVAVQKRTADAEDRRWWKLVPRDWVMFSDHYMIAREMQPNEFSYLLKLPLKLYVPSAHLFVVHGGLLPSDPRYPYYDASRQPLARIPISLENVVIADGKGDDNLGSLRKMQEMALLTEIPQNLDPWASLNMRSVKGGKVVKSNKGDPWSKLWKKEMEHCVGFNHELKVPSNTSSKNKHPLPCYPSTVVYGHAAARGLDVKRWTVGLDSGCIYGRRLSALVIGGRKGKTRRLDEVAEEKEEDEEEEDLDVGSITDIEDAYGLVDAGKSHNSDVIIPFGDNGTARIVSVRCQEPR